MILNQNWHFLWHQKHAQIQTQGIEWQRVKWISIDDFTLQIEWQHVTHCIIHFMVFITHCFSFESSFTKYTWILLLNQWLKLKNWRSVHFLFFGICDANWINKNKKLMKNVKRHVLRWSMLTRIYMYIYTLIQHYLLIKIAFGYYFLCTIEDIFFFLLISSCFLFTLTRMFMFILSQ